VDGGRKRTILIAASILVARNCAQLDGRPAGPALDAAISHAISLAERIMAQIEGRTSPARTQPSQTMTSAAEYPWKGRG
jgi:hypothetical protein